MGVGIVAVDDVVFLAEVLVGLDERLFAAVEQTPGVMDVEEGHDLVPAFLVIALDHLLELGVVAEGDVADFVAGEFVVDDDARDVIGSDLLDVFRTELVVEDDGSIDVGGDDLLDHGEGFFPGMGGGEQSEEETLLFRNLGDAVEKIGDVDVVRAGNHDADVG